jgi:hypothetical protein
MTDKEREFDELIRKNNRGTKACKCLEAMLEGFRKPYYQDDGCMYKEEPQEKERKTE